MTPKHVFWDQETSAPHHTLGAMRSALLATQKTLKSMGPKIPQADLPAFTPLHFTLPPLPAEEQRAVAAEVKKKLPWEVIARRSQDVTSAESMYSTAPERPAREPTSITWRNGLPPTGSSAASPSGREVASKPGGGSREGRRSGSRGGSSRGGSSRGGGSRDGRSASSSEKSGGGGAGGAKAVGGGEDGAEPVPGPGREMFMASLQAPTPRDEGAPMAYAFPMSGDSPAPRGVDAGVHARAGASAGARADAAPTTSAPPPFGEDLRDGLCDLPEKDSYSRKEVLQARMQHSKQIHRLQASFEERLQKMHGFYQQQIESAQATAAARAGSPRVKYRQQRVPEGRQVRFSSHMFLPPKFSGLIGGRGG